MIKKYIGHIAARVTPGLYSERAQSFWHASATAWRGGVDSGLD